MMRPRTRVEKFTALILAAMVTVAMAGCGSGTTASNGASAASSGPPEFDRIVTAAESEGSVTLYTPAQQSVVDAWTAGFQAAYPRIKLSVFRASPGQLIAKMATDDQAQIAGADVIVTSLDGPTSTTATLEAQGKLTALTGPRLKDKDFQAAMESPNRFYVYASAFGWAWNTDLLPNGIHSWQDFLDASLANGKVAVWDPSISALLPKAYDAVVTASGDGNYMARLAEQKPGIYPSSEALENAVAAGEVAATMFATKRTLTLKDQGAPVGFATPPQPSGVAGIEGGVLKAAAHPNAAQVLANWLASEDGQKCVLVSGTPARSNVPGNDIDFATLKPTIPVTPEQQKAFVDKFNALFHK
jgi:iron(III) transport system substrate-binding protein